MAETKYGKYFMRGPKPGEKRDFYKKCTTFLDDDVIKGSFYFIGCFLTPEESVGTHSPHTHPYPELILFHGLNPDDPNDLGGEVEIHMGPEFETHNFNKNMLIYLPAEFPHCPILYRMKKPGFHMYCFTGPLLVRDDYLENLKQDTAFERQYDKYFIRGPKPGEERDFYKKCTIYLDDEVLKGSEYSFLMAFASSDSPPEVTEPHAHPYGEVIGFYGNDPKNRFDLGAEIEYAMGEELEKHTFNQSTLIYIPPGMVHCPIKYKINRPFIYLRCALGPKFM